MEKEMGKKEKSIKSYWWIFFTAIIFWIVFIIIIFWSANDFIFQFPPSAKLESLGVFGDSFNILNTLFTGLAFSGVIVSIILQTQELKEAREEYAGSRQALEQQKKEMEQQSFDNRFFKMIDMFNDVKEKINLNEILKKVLDQTLIDTKNEKRTNSNFSKNHIQNFLKKEFKSSIINQPNIKLFYKNLEVILGYTNQHSNVKTKQLLIDIIKAQLSNNELLSILIYLEIEKNDELRDLVKQNKITEYFTVEALDRKYIDLQNVINTLFLDLSEKV